MPNRKHYTSPPTQGGEGPSAQIFQLEPEKHPFVVIKSRVIPSIPSEVVQAILAQQAARRESAAATAITEGEV